MACVVRSLPGAVGTLLSSTSVRAHVCLALTSPKQSFANDVAPLEPVAGALLSLRVGLDTATCVPALASWPTSTWHVALCDLQPFSSRAGPCTSACVLPVCCIPHAWRSALLLSVEPHCLVAGLLYGAYIRSPAVYCSWRFVAALPPCPNPCATLCALP